MEISIVETPHRGGGSIVDAYVAQLAELRDEGLTRVWSTQMSFERDLLTAMAVALREVDTIEVGTGVLPIQNQHPMLLAQRALKLDTISSGRLILGLGMTHRVVAEGSWVLRAAGVDEFVASTFDPSPEGRARTRALLRKQA